MVSYTTASSMLTSYFALQYVPLPSVVRDAPVSRLADHARQLNDLPGEVTEAALDVHGQPAKARVQAENPCRRSSMFPSIVSRSSVTSD